MEKQTLRQWQGWRDDARCTRPAVTCQKCDTHYPRGQDEGNAIYNGFNLVSCGKCQVVEFHPSHESKVDKAKTRGKLRLAQHIAQMRRAHMKRVIYRDVAVRYLRLFGGKTFAVQTDVDACEIYLENKQGTIIGKVSTLDLYPKGIDEVIVDEIPY